MSLLTSAWLLIDVIASRRAAKVSSAIVSSVAVTVITAISCRDSSASSRGRKFERERRRRSAVDRIFDGMVDFFEASALGEKVTDMQRLNAARSLLGRDLTLAVVKRCGAEENAALGDFGDAGAANGGRGTGDEAVEPLPGLFEGVRDGARADVADVAGETVDQLAAHTGGFELHAGEFDDSGAGLMRDDETNVVGASAGGF